MRIDHQTNAQRRVGEQGGRFQGVIDEREVHARSYTGLAIRVHVGARQHIQPFVRTGHVNTSVVLTGRRKRSHATVGRTVVQLQAETGRWACFPTGSSHPDGKSRTLVFGEQGRPDLLGY
ncbi:uncharacterized protein B0T23DRAFT_401330 [Neurospora hispaniola]|uniref:Uncharacterized protein n=1 Tax=Neurospora hispaniola TaxID=588809 RepID=A0AAJ0MVJ7_9PEZI|nr:hypothetical protein B0T23DRAFT_401330 [Neurospora hispaniola]